MNPGKSYYIATKNMSLFHNTIESFWAQHLSTLSKDEIASLNAECDLILHLLCTPDVRLSRSDILEALLAALYFQRYGESPTMTMMKARTND